MNKRDRDLRAEIRPIRQAEPVLTRGLSGLQLQVARDLMSAKTYTDVARKHGLDRKTVYNWLNKDAKFRAYLDRQQADLLGQIAARMVKLTFDSTELMERALAGEVELSGDQKFIIDLSSKRLPRLLDQALIFSKLAALEERLAELNE